MLKTLLGAGGVLAGLALCLPSASADDFIVGVGVHSPAEQDLASVQDAGVGSVRDDIHWAEVEREPGSLLMPERYDRAVDTALRRGFQPVLILCYGNPLYDGGAYPLSDKAREAYVRFAEFVVAHFRGRVRRYEIWNEWNIAMSLPPGTPRRGPEPYVDLLRAVYPRLKAIDPKATVIGGALSGNGVETGWLEGACRAGMLDCLDAFSFHPYCYRQGEGARLPEQGFLKLVRDSRAVVARWQKREIPVYLTEVGWPTHEGPDGSTPEEEACFLARTYLLARTMPWVRGLWWYDLRDDGTDPHEREHHFGLLNLDRTPKPALAALRGIGSFFREARYVGAVRLDADAAILKFQQESGAGLYAMWSGVAPATHVTVEAQNNAVPPTAKYRDFRGHESVGTWKRDGARWTLDVALTASPLVLDTGSAPLAVTFRFADGSAARDADAR